MENHKRKRGISLTHHQRSISSIVQSSVSINEPSQASTTRIHYSRYPLQQSTSRHTSAPKPTVNFCYNVISEGSLIPTPLEIRECEVQTSEVSRVSHILKESSRSQYPSYERIDSQNTLVQYQSFEHCKEVLGKRLFGDSEVHQQKQNLIQRPNRIQQPFLHPDTCLLNDNTWNSVSNNITTAPLNSYQKATVPPTVDKREKEAKPLRISNIENIIIKPSIQLKKEMEMSRNPKRETMNLNEMQRRLRQIIKICDENI